MYYYVYDEFVQNPKFERELALIETTLTDLGVSGKIARMALFRDAKELIRDEIQRGAKTIVAVGNDLTLRKVIDAVGDTGVAIGIIPLGPADQRIAELLGIPQGSKACEAIAARNIEQIDTGVVNGQRFIHTADIHPTGDSSVLIDGQFTMFPPKKKVLEVRNLAAAEEGAPGANPTDEKLELVIRGGKEGWISKRIISPTRIPFKEAVVTVPSGGKIQVDGEWFEGTEFRFSVIAHHMQLIAGKNRKF